MILIILTVLLLIFLVILIIRGKDEYDDYSVEEEYEYYTKHTITGRELVEFLENNNDNRVCFSVKLNKGVYDFEVIRKKDVSSRSSVYYINPLKEFIAKFDYYEDKNGKRDLNTIMFVEYDDWGTI